MPKGGTCRCPMCGVKNAGKKNRSAYLRAHIGKDEHGYDWNRLTKRETRKLLRTREKRVWKFSQE